MTGPYHVVRDPKLVAEVLRRPDDFLPTNALTSVVPLAPATLRTLSRVGFSLPPVLASATGAAHLRVRRAVAQFFTPAKVQAVQSQVAALMRTQSAAAAELLVTGNVDLAAIAHSVPPAIMAELTGLHCPDLERLKRWSRHSLELFWGWPDDRRQLELAGSAAQLYEWLRAQVLAADESRSLLATLRAAGMSVTDVCALAYFLVIAGQETTSQLINIAFYRALADGQVWSDLAAGAPATKFVRDVLACESSVHTWRRRVGHDTELAGVALPAGTEVLLELSGNHSPNRMPSAYSLAFGHGIHRCLGAGLAEMEAVTVLQETARALPDLALSGPEPQWLRLLSFQTPLQVMVGRGVAPRQVSSAQPGSNRCPPGLVCA